MSVTDGCNKDTNAPIGSNVRTLIFTTQQLTQIEQGLQERLDVLRRLSADNPGNTDFLAQLDEAKDAVAIVRRAM